jgi:ubiquinone/menaquinone biosynthesis C-methylase UbiE
MTHFEQLLTHVPDLKERRILDIGSGRGGFLLDAAAHGASATGIELYAPYREETVVKAREHALSVQVVGGKAEALPFPDASFDFVNMSEVLEHVEDPEVVLNEAYRVLTPGGLLYASIPNRYGLRDPHYHLYFVNWMPRALGEWVLARLGKTKESGGNGRQKLTDMHYATFGEAKTLFKDAGFSVKDIREEKVIKRFPLVLPFYFLLRTVYFDTFHLLATTARTE